MESDYEVKSQATELSDEVEVLSGRSESVEGSKRGSTNESVHSVGESGRSVERSGSESGSSRRSSEISEDSDLEAGPDARKEEESSGKIFANPFASGMERDERLLRCFLLLGIFPLPAVGWIMGLFGSFTIKTKKRIHKKLTALLFLLSIISVSFGIAGLGYFLVKSTDKPIEVNVPAVAEVKEVVKPVEKVELENLVNSVDVEAIRKDHESGQILGEYKPVVIVESYKEPEFKYETPKLKYIPPLVLEEPKTVTKTEDELTFDYFEYKHPSSKGHALIFLRHLDSSWIKHEMFRFSDYIDHSVLAVNLTKNDKKKSFEEILKTLEKVFELSKRTPLTLVSDLTEEEMTKLESTYTTMKIDKIFAINPKMRCLTKEIKEPFVEFVSINDEKIKCNSGSVDFPTQVTEGGRIRYAPRAKKLGDIKTYFFSSKETCTDSGAKPEVTKIYLDRLYSPLRKFLITPSKVKSDTFSLDVLCSKIE